MAGSAPMMDSQSLHQTYLRGPTLHLRAIEREDAASESFWRASPFPRAPAVAAARIEEELGPGSMLIAARNHDGVIVGSVRIETSGPLSHVKPFVARWLDLERADAVEAEIIELLLPFLIDEQGSCTALVEIASGKPAVLAALERIGARLCYRHREAMLVGAERRDKLGYQLFDPRAIATFGMPEIVPEGEIERAVQTPAPKMWPVVETPPAGLVIMGERLYLRVVTPEDILLMRDGYQTETETAHEPRSLQGAMEIEISTRRNAEASPRTNLHFCFALRANDEFIGRNKLQHLDLHNRCAETATRIYRPEHRGQGYGTEAKHLLLTYAFEVLNLHMVWSHVWEINPRSRAALLKQGYRLAGTKAWRQYFHGSPSSDWTFDLLASEWQAARREQSALSSQPSATIF
jgi:RimJ/RimL family protein N-acetyltransferase